MNYTIKLLFQDVKFSIVALKSLLSEKNSPMDKVVKKSLEGKPTMLELFYISGQSGFPNFLKKSSIRLCFYNDKLR